MARARVYPPGPARSIISTLTYRPARDPLAFFTDLASRYGDLVHLRMGPERAFLVNDPALIRDVLVTNQRFFHKGRALERSKRLLGEGLLTSEDAVHVRQRRLLQPAFHRDAVAGYAGVMTDFADRARSRWQNGSTIDIAQEMMRITLGIVGKTLFDADVESQARDVGEALTAVLESFWTMLLPFAGLLEHLPVPALRKSRAAQARLDKMMYAMIAERHAAASDRGDMLSMLLLAQDDEQQGRSLTDQQVRDEAMTIFLAGHETTANALSWMWYLVSGAPDVESRMHEEIDRVLAGRLPTIADIPHLTYVEQVITEALRLYPPAWMIGRRAVAEQPLGNYVLPPRALVLLSPYVTQRDARHFAEPDRFMPERWTPEFRASLEPFAYFPFGGGSRRCIGESFAMMELVLVASTIARRWAIRVVPGHPVVPQPLMTLRLKHGLRATVHARADLSGRASGV
jgi:cytochrome P450